MTERIVFNLNLQHDGSRITLGMVRPDGAVLGEIAFTATELDDLMRGLSQARAQMHPQVSPALEVGTQVVATFDPKWRTEPDVEAGVTMLAIRHPGFGWTGFALPRHEVQALGEALLRSIGNLTVRH